jgi:hypothetical protein
MSIARRSTWWLVRKSFASGSIEKHLCWRSTWHSSEEGPVSASTESGDSFSRAIADDVWELFDDRADPVRELTDIGVDSWSLVTSATDSPRGGASEHPSAVGEWTDKRSARITCKKSCTRSLQVFENTSACITRSLVVTSAEHAVQNLAIVVAWLVAVISSHKTNSDFSEQI